MDVSVTGIGSGTGTTKTAAAGLDGISGTDFMNILIKQLQYQDPFEPMGNQEMVAQMSTIRELEMNTRLSGKLEQLTDQQRFGSAGALIGKYVQGSVADADGNQFPAEGVVVGVRFTSRGEVMLDLDSGEVLPLTALENITTPEEAGAVPLKDNAKTLV